MSVIIGSRYTNAHIVRRAPGRFEELNSRIEGRHESRLQEALLSHPRIPRKERMNMYIVPQDKVLHVIAGALVAAAATPLGPIAMVISPAVAGLGKEAYDWACNKWADMHSQPRPHGVESADALSTAGGGWFATLVILATQWVMA